ncbi:MAG: hypothetical protein AAB470_03135 [Patescibacteria group bacterium]
MNKTEAPTLKPFDNIVTKTILAIIILLGFIGLSLAINGNLVGIPIFIVGLLMMKVGLTEHSADPRTAGLLTFWDSPIEISGECVVVGGTTILANYFPFYLGSIKIDMTNHDKDFPMKILSHDNVQMVGQVSITLQPDPKDLLDYVQAGKMEKIFAQLDDIIFRETQKVCREKRFGWKEINIRGDEIASEIKRGIFRKNEYSFPAGLEQHSFGVVVRKLQVKLLPPNSIIENAEQRADEILQREGENFEYETTLRAAKVRLEEYHKDPKLKVAVTLRDCIDEIRHERQIRQGQSFRVDSGGTGNATIGVVNVNTGGQKNK